MKKEITTTITAAEAVTTENIEKQEEKDMRKEIKLEKFTDEESYRRQKYLPALYAKREKFIGEFVKYYVKKGITQTSDYQEAVEKGWSGYTQMMDKFVKMSDIFMNYMTEFITTARAWEQFFSIIWDAEFYGAEPVISQIDFEMAVRKLYRELKEMVKTGTFAVDGKYRVVKIPYGTYKGKKTCSQEYEEKLFEKKGALKYSFYDSLRNSVSYMYIKTGHYDADTKSIEVYIPESYKKDIEAWISEENAGDLDEMAKENKAQEEEDMEERKELAEKKQEIISSVESWYEGCYDAIYDLTKSVKNTNKYSRNRDTIEARKLEQYWKLMGYSRGNGDEREADFDTIRNAVIDYLREQPLEYFEDIEDPFNEDSMLDIIDDAYNYADFELSERPDRKEEWLEFVRTCPADWFDYADDPEQERENLIEMYEDWDDVVFCDFDYAVNGEYSDPYTTMRDDA